jgi:hypothetical protein
MQEWSPRRFVTQELFLAEVINAEIVYAVQFIVSQASPGGSPSFFAGSATLCCSSATL